MTKISCHPENPLVDEVVHIKVQGLSAGAPYTIRSSLCENKTNFSACGCYIADDNGVVDVGKSFCIEGTYSGIEPMGLFWSMKQEPGYKRYIRIIKLNILETLRVNLSVYEGIHDWETVCKNELEPVASTFIDRWYKSKDVKRIRVKSGRLRGRLFVPPGDGPFPGIIDLFGGAGGLMEFRAALLASRGFVTYALPYFNFEDLQFDPDNTLLDIDYFLEAVDYLSSFNFVNKVGIIGVSKGAEYAMLTTRLYSVPSSSLVNRVLDDFQCECITNRHNQKVKAAVFINGPPFLTLFDLKFGNTIYKCVDKDIGYHNVIFLKKMLNSKLLVNKLWKTEANILYIVGEDDQTTDPNLANVLLNRYPKDKQSLIELKSYPNAGHLIEPPFMPLCQKSYNPQFGKTLLARAV
ncbi:hypothetical protein KUTeg_014229 [Tegillarca granosa]|uniref:Uncharacterized protein n=1 Tax=Tegillarca granosa TaxID=220873 RepID=A0ABQ9EZS3_TEGGR|nr:hypothetical protein KUTeg_014229 [Tegillarca granosa]